MGLNSAFKGLTRYFCEILTAFLVFQVSSFRTDQNLRAFLPRIFRRTGRIAKSD